MIAVAAIVQSVARVSRLRSLGGVACIGPVTVASR
jgi:hypothetical protein